MAQPPLDTAVESLVPLFVCQKYDYVYVLCFSSLTISGHESACPVRSSANTELEVCSSVSDLMKPLHFVHIYLMAQKEHFLYLQTLPCPSPIKSILSFLT